MDIVTILIVMILGIFAGIFTGLIPGVHINMIAGLILINIVFLLKYFELNYLVIFIISMSITHTFIDFIPSLVFGVPSADTSLSVLPGHKLVMEGRAYEAVFLSAIGSFFAIFTSSLIIPIFFLVLDSLYTNFKTFIPYLLALVVILLIIIEKGKTKKFWALIIVLFSGGYGMLILNSHLFSNPLLILFTGCFGIASLTNSLLENTSKLPKQNFEFDFKFNSNFFKALTIGTISSSVCSITPGIGNCQAAIISSIFVKNLSSRMFIVILSCINTVNFVLSIVTLYIIDRARNGSILAVSQLINEISFSDLIVMLLVVLFVGIISFFLTLKIGKKVILFVSKINFRLFTIQIIIFIFIIVFLFDGFYGEIALLGAIGIGLLCILMNVSRVHLMNVLIIPVIFNLI